jgi:hypothetical protein
VVGDDSRHPFSALSSVPAGIAPLSQLIILQIRFPKTVGKPAVVDHE